MALTAHCAHFYLARYPPNTASKTSRVETSFASAAWKPDTHRSKMLKLMNEHLEHLHETKDLFDHLARSRPPHQRNSRKTKRNLFCATSLGSRDLVRFLRTFLQASSFVT